MAGSNFKVFSAWCGFIYINMMGIAWIFLMDAIPAHNPSSSAAEIAELFSQQNLGMKIGAILVMMGCFTLSLYTAVTSKLIQKIEGHFGTMTLAYVISSTLGMVIQMMSAVFWGTAAFRADRSPELIQLLNDLAWLNFFATAPALFAQFICLFWAAVIAKNKSLNILPKWYGLLCLWVLIAIIPGALCITFQTGPFAWNGLIVFWFALVVFSAAYILSPRVMVPAVKQHL
jgi:hypothetical protein